MEVPVELLGSGVTYLLSVPKTATVGAVADCLSDEHGLMGVVRLQQGGVRKKRRLLHRDEPVPPSELLEAVISEDPALIASAGIVDETPLQSALLAHKRAVKLTRYWGAGFPVDTADYCSNMAEGAAFDKEVRPQLVMDAGGPAMMEKVPAQVRFQDGLLSQEACTALKTALPASDDAGSTVLIDPARCLGGKKGCVRLPTPFAVGADGGVAVANAQAYVADVADVGADDGSPALHEALRAAVEAVRPLFLTVRNLRAEQPETMPSSLELVPSHAVAMGAFDPAAASHVEAAAATAAAGSGGQPWLLRVETEPRAGETDGPAYYTSSLAVETKNMSFGDAELRKAVQAVLDSDDVREAVPTAVATLKAGCRLWEGGKEVKVGKAKTWDAFKMAFDGSLEVLRATRRRLVNAANVNDLHSERGTTLLYTACRFGHAEMAAWLVTHRGADVNQANGPSGGGSTPLHGAAYGGHPEVLRMLLEAGADATRTNKYGDTPADDAGRPADGVSKKTQGQCAKLLSGQAMVPTMSRVESLYAAAEAAAGDGWTNGGTTDEDRKRALLHGVHTAVSVSGAKGWKVSETQSAGCRRRQHEAEEQLRSEATSALAATAQDARLLQVTFEVRDVVVTDGTPVWEGDAAWQSAGLPEENIVATAVCCFAEENTTPMRLQFRRAAQGATGVKPVWRYLGDARVRVGRCVAFPSDTQVRVEPVQLGKGGVGRVRLLTMQLVDPEDPVVSTDKVPREGGGREADRLAKNQAEFAARLAEHSKVVSGE